MKEPKSKTQYAFIILTMTLLWLSHASAATINAVNCSAAAIQTAINAAQDGDIVLIPAGSCTWASSDIVRWTNKNITVLGAGQGQTVITQAGKAFYITVSDATKAAFRLSSFTLTGSPTDFSVTIAATALAAVASG